MHFFLHGASGIGKSTLLQEALTPIVPMVAGFSTQRIFKNGESIGHRAVIVNGLLHPLETTYSDVMDGVFLLNGQRDISVLEKRISQVERIIQNQDIKLVLLDEIGGIELKSELFMESLNRILMGEKPCIGVFKSVDNLAQTSSVLKLGAEYPELHKEMQRLICRTGTLMRLTNESGQDVRTCLNRFIQSIIKR